MYWSENNKKINPLKSAIIEMKKADPEGSGRKNFRK
jgi:hypothetical protein